MSFINTLPLIDGLENLADVSLRHSVPSLLIDELLAGRVDVALCSSIDYLRSPTPLALLPVGMLGCDGPTMTVRLYSNKPLHEITSVHCDTDSHTSVALLPHTPCRTNERPDRSGESGIMLFARCHLPKCAVA